MKVEDKKNLAGVKAGDKVEITYTEAVMISVATGGHAATVRIASGSAVVAPARLNGKARRQLPRSAALRA